MKTIVALMITALAITTQAQTISPFISGPCQPNGSVALGTTTYITTYPAQCQEPQSNFCGIHLKLSKAKHTHNISYTTPLGTIETSKWKVTFTKPGQQTETFIYYNEAGQRKMMSVTFQVQ